MDMRKTKENIEHRHKSKETRSKKQEQEFIS